MKLEPLQQWICDECGELIDGAEQGWLEWLSLMDKPAWGFRIVHHISFSPSLPRGPHEGCYGYGSALERKDNHLNIFVGIDGLSKLLYFVDYGQVDPGDSGPHFKSAHEFAEIFRRLQIPYYEEARQYWAKAQNDGYFDDANEVSPYFQGSLRRIIEKYGDDEMDK